MVVRTGTEKMPRLYQMKPEKVESWRRKITRVGGSVMVPLPRKLRQDLGIGVGDYVSIKRGEDETIMIEKERKIWDGRIARKD